MHNRVLLTAMMLGCGGEVITGSDNQIEPPRVTTVTIEMLNNAFVAKDITISLGSSIRWINQDVVQHTATSSNVPSGGAAINSPFLSQGQSFTFTPKVIGTWTYFCQVHPITMVGATITVEEAADY